MRVYGPDSDATIRPNMESWSTISFGNLESSDRILVEQMEGRTDKTGQFVLVPT
jgi:hypothetical protein